MLFAGDEVVWDTWKYAEEGDMPFLRHKKKLVEAYVRQGMVSN
jgi:hypothetical protein